MSDAAEPTPLEIRSRGVVLSSRERAETERAFWFTLGKYQPALRRAVVTLSVANGDEPGWLSCQVSAVDRSGSLLFVEGADRDVATCVARTFGRAEREMRRRASALRRCMSQRAGT